MFSSSPPRAMFSSRVHNKYARPNSSYSPSRKLHHTYATTPRSLHLPLSPQSSRASTVSRASTITPLLHSLPPPLLSCDLGALGDVSCSVCSEDSSTRQCQALFERKDAGETNDHVGPDTQGEDSDIPQPEEEHVELRSAKVAEYIQEVNRLGDATDDSAYSSYSDNRFGHKTKTGRQGCFPFPARFSAASARRLSFGSALMEYLLPREFWSSSQSPAMSLKRAK